MANEILKRDENHVPVSAGVTNDANLEIRMFRVGTDGILLSAPVLIDEFGIKATMLGDNYFLGAPVMIDSAHHEIHCGDMISLCYTVDMAGGANADILFITPNNAATGKRYHFDFKISCEAEFGYKLYESPTTTANGTPLVARNRNRQDQVVAENEVLYYHTPTVTVVGTELDCEHLGSLKIAGGSTRSDGEWVLGNNKNYLVRVSNSTDANNWASIKINYYVHPGI